MDPLLTILYKLFDIGLILIGFGLVVFIHEFGHFIAAKWAKVRVLAFAIGFGNAVVSYRKGFGLRRGSSEQEYNEWLVRKADGATAVDEEISPTEYRLNMLPLGGYVKMLGQDDAHPTYRDDAPDSYTSVPNWKRMIIISAGVTMNVLTAAALYVIVFTAGLNTEPPLIGSVERGSPAESASLFNAEKLGIEKPGLLPGDLIVSINGSTPSSFNDVILASAMAKGEAKMDVHIQRDGFADELVFEMVPVKSELGLQQIGVGPAWTTTLRMPPSDKENQLYADTFARMGLEGIPFGATLVSINGEEVSHASDLDTIASKSQGEPSLLEFELDGEISTVSMQAAPVMELTESTIAGQETNIQHVLGFTPVMQVGPFGKNVKGFEQGLREGDIFVRLGATSYPNQIRGVTEVQSRAGNDINAIVLRETESGTELVELLLRVGRDGTIGFNIAGSHQHTVLADSVDSGGASLGADSRFRPGSRVISIAGQSVHSFSDIQLSLKAALVESNSDSVEIVVEIPLVGDDGLPVRRSVSVAITPEHVQWASGMQWRYPIDPFIFMPEITTLKADGPIDALAMGLHETHRVMRTTYLTFLRLFQGSVSPKNLNGPVGIVHIGTVVVSRGFIWLLFFFALVNINLAVINFLPIPITDGGHMIFLIWEQLTGKPVSIAVQNAATLVGLVLIVSVFLFVTFNDISRLFGV
jgi:regulator of sigma E protease